MASDLCFKSEVVIDSEDAAVALFSQHFAGLTRETLHVAHLDGNRRLLAERVFHSSMCDTVDLPLRDIIRDALTLDAEGIVIAHNHPSGDPEPSRADLLATRALVDLTRPLGIRVHDHLIFGGGKMRSLHAIGLL